MLHQVTRTLLTIMQMRYLTILLCVGTLMCAVMVDAFNGWKPDTPDRDWEDSPGMRHQLTLANKHQAGIPSWLQRQAAPQRKRAGSMHFRDPQWRLCITMCMDSCSMWDSWGGKHFMYCTESCMKIGYKSFNPDQYCFDFGDQNMDFK